MKLRYILLAFLTTAFIASCGKDNPSSPDPPDPPEEEVASEEIGSDGGEITSLDGNLTLTFPEGALSGTETITIGELREDDLGSEFDEIIDSLGIGGVYELGPDGLQFDEPVTATLASDQTAALNDSTLELSIRRLMFISSDGQGELLDSLRIEPAGDGSGDMQLSGEISHFSEFAFTNTDNSGLLTARITGIPEQLQVNEEVGLNIRADVSFVQVKETSVQLIYTIDHVFVPSSSINSDGSRVLPTDFPDIILPEVTSNTGNENFQKTVPYTCLRVGSNEPRGVVTVELSDEQSGSNEFLSREKLFVGFTDLLEEVQEVQCVEEMPPANTPEVTNFSGELTGLTSIEYEVGLNYTGSLGSLDLEIDYGDGNTANINNDDLEETSEGSYEGSWEYNYGTTGNFMPKVTATNTESGESDSESGGLQEVNLTVNKDGDGTGTVIGTTPDGPPFGALEIINCGSKCSQLVFFDPVFLAFVVPPELTAEPADGSVFAGWSGDIGDANSESETIGVAMDQNRTVTATFEPKPTFTLEVDTEGEGEVSNDPGGNRGGDFTEEYIEGTIVTLTAHPSSGWVFTGWIGDTDDENPETTCRGTNNCKFEMDEHRSITAIFEKETSENVLTTGVLSPPSGLDLLEAFFLLFHYGDLFLSSNKASLPNRFTQQAQQANTQFGELSGTFPVAFSGSGKVAVVDLLTNELLMEIDASSISPLYGVAAVATEPAHESAAFVIYGANGTGDVDTQGGGTFSSGLGAFYDAVPAGGDIYSGTYIKTGGSTMLQTYNTEYGYYSFPDGHGHVYGNKFEDDRYPVSSWVPDRPEDNWPATIGVGRNDETLESSVFLIDTQGENDPVKIADVGQDARKVRCTPIEESSNNLICGVTVFGEDRLALYTWDGETEPITAGTVDVGDGPVNLDLRLLPNGNIGVVTSGFNDDTITEIELATDGGVISNKTRSVPTECESPGHAKFIRDAESLKLIGTCYDSANYFIVESEL